MDCQTFNESLQEIFAKTKKGKQIISEMVENIMYDKEQDEFDDYIQNRNNELIQINDDEYFTPYLYSGHPRLSRCCFKTLYIYTLLYI